MPGSALLESLRFRVDPEKVVGTASAGVHVTDTGEDTGLILRNGILEATTIIPKDASFVVSVPKQLVAGMVFLNPVDVLRQGIEAGAASFTVGDIDDAAAFFGHFDTRAEDRITLADR